MVSLVKDHVPQSAFLFQKIALIKIAAATAVACTDRSKRRWKQNQRANKKEEALQGNL